MCSAQVFHINDFLSKTKVGLWTELTLHSADTQTAGIYGKNKSSCSPEGILLGETESAITVGYTHTLNHTLYYCKHTWTPHCHTRRSEDVLFGRCSLHSAARRDRCPGFSIGAAWFGAPATGLLLHGDPEESERPVGDRGQEAEGHRWPAGAQFGHHPVLVLRQGIRGQTPPVAGAGDSNLKILIKKTKQKNTFYYFCWFYHAEIFSSVASQQACWLDRTFNLQKQNNSPGRRTELSSCNNFHLQRIYTIFIIYEQNELEMQYISIYLKWGSFPSFKLNDLRE